MYAFVILLLPVLLIVSCEQVLASNLECEYRCLNSSSKCFQFFKEKLYFQLAKQECFKKNKGELLSQELYTNNKTCFNKYLEDSGSSTASVWLDSTEPKINRALVFNSTEMFNGSQEHSQHFRICILQGTNSTPANEISTNTTPDKDLTEINTKVNSANNKSTSVTSKPGSPISDKDNEGNSGNNNNDMTGADNSKTREDNHFLIAVPLVLATTAIVLSICCCTCVVCGVILYKKREMIIRSIRKINIPDSGATNPVEAVELRSTVNVCAKIKPSRPNNGRYQRESRLINNSLHTDNDSEIYSTVDTDNVYSNVNYLMRSRSLEQPHKLYCETSTRKPYGGTRDSCIRPPDYAQCFASPDREAETVSGRYISDGLLYVTVDHATHGRKTKPVKAKSEEHVDYLKLDFEKTGKMNRKKNKSVDRIGPVKSRSKISA